MQGGLRRRRLLAVVGAAAAAGLAGCSEGDPPATGSASAPPTTADVATDSTTASPASPSPSSSAAADLDLREANVTAVAVEGGDGRVSFDVTLYHDDDGEDGYANWWQVETLDGETLGRRELLHAHGTREFTRSDTFEIPDTVQCVVVRGHDQTHGYGGQAMVVALDTGATRAVRQGPERQSLDDDACP